MSESKSSDGIKTFNRDHGLVLTILISIFSILILVLDWQTQLGYAVWLLYFIPLIISMLVPRLNLLILTLIITIFIIVGFFLSPQGITSSIAIFNRGLSVIIMWVLMVILIHQRKLGETILTASQYARSLLEASLDPLVTINAEGKITDVNEASVQAIGVPSEQLIGTDFSDYFTDPVKAREGYQKVLSDGFVRDYPLAICHVSGSVMEVLYNASVYKDDKDAVLGVFAAARDVTQQKLFNQQLREKNTEFEVSKIAAEKANQPKKIS